LTKNCDYCHEHGIVHRDLKVSLNSVLDGLYHFMSISVVCHYTSSYVKFP
jgi:serine/threonine protein kinase